MQKNLLRNYTKNLNINHVGTRGVMVIVIGNGHGDTNSNSEPG